MQNKKNIIIIILLIIIILILGYVAFLKPEKVNQDTVANYQPPVTNTPAVTPSQNNPTPVATNIKTYTSPDGFSFNYPSSWKLSEDLIKKEVTINTNDNALLVENHTYPSWSITFKATDKTFFTQQRISTKMGIITYDENTKALMSDSCLKATQLFGSNPPIQSITYGGSLMSDPAYSDSAILTTTGEIIIVHSQQGAVITPELSNQLSQIASSFKLLNGNTVFVPECAR